MKNHFILLSLCLSISAFATSRLGSKCGLTDSMGEEGWEKVGKWTELSRATDEKISKLPTLMKQQLIITAKEEAARFKEEVEIKNTLDAVKYLRENSEAGDLYLQDQRVKGKVYTEVVHFPGGNPYGAIFAKGSLRVIAFNQDDTLYCK